MAYEHTPEQPALAVEVAKPPRQHVYQYAFTVLLAAAGGVLGIIGAIFGEIRAGGLVPIFAAPVIEEILKPAGIYVAVLRWPAVVSNRIWRGLLGAIAGLSFGAIESLIYVTVYAPDHSISFVVYRFTVALALHAVASFIASLGITTALLDWANRGGRFPTSSRNAYVAAMALHACYNATVIALGVAGKLQFD